MNKGTFRRMFAQLLPVLGILLIASPGNTCPFCFNDQISSQPRSAQAGVLVLIGFIVFVLGTIASIAYQWARRAKALEKRTG